MSHEEPCAHESWDCLGGFHHCNDCKRGLGTLRHILEEHDIYACDLCFGVVEPNEAFQKAARKAKEVFITKDSGERQEYDSGMRRDLQDGKPRFDLLLVEGLPFEEQFLTRFASLLERGATKYGERNWQLASSEEELSRFRASALRHMVQWAAGERDEDHMAAVAFNLMAYEATQYKLENHGGIGKTL